MAALTRPPARGARRLTLLALFTAIALTIFMVEAQIPVPIPIPGVKLGLANIVTVYVMFVLGPGDALLVLSARVFLGAVFSGQMSTLLYSAGGGLLCWAGPMPAEKGPLQRPDLAVQSCGCHISQPGPAPGGSRSNEDLGGFGLSPLSGHGRRGGRSVYPGYVPRCSSDIWRKYIKKLPTQRVGSFL